MTQEEKEKIIKALQDKGALLPCPRCGNDNFGVMDGYSNISVQDEMLGFVIGGRTLPSIIAACNRCGFISQHALGALGLLPGLSTKADTTKENPSST